ncbi:MAG: sodium:solute symporter family protein [Desulfobacterales bacterium]|nr:sodium:solute symporter family protein [Desulfobacterales bacterium]
MGMKPIDFGVIITYFILVLVIGFLLRKISGKNKEEYFLGGRNMPWWLAGISIVATNFAADTPLAVSGIIASKGLSGNWLWLPWLGIHSAVIIFFAAAWRKTGVLTDAQFVAIRYSGTRAGALRLLRASVSGILLNCIILAWIFSAVLKISSVFFSWDKWFPELFDFVSKVMPASGSLGSPNDAITLVILLLIIGIYSSMGGIRAVIITDFIQFFLSLVGGVWLAINAWIYVGGQQGLSDGLEKLYGSGHQFLNLFPSEAGWMSALEIGWVLFAVYLFVQSFSGIDADGGGYMMQRLATTRNAADAQKASLLFLIFQYLIRIWPWFIVGLAALIVLPLGQDVYTINQTTVVLRDREGAYPVLMTLMLPPGVLGLVLASLLAAFMSTVDTHINWGASYIINDWLLKMFPGASDKAQILIARIAVVLFLLTALFISTQIGSIESGWRAVATIGAAFGTPTLLRWFWWRINADAELLSIAAGILTGGFFAFFTDISYEYRLILTSLSSLLGVVMGVIWGAPTPAATINQFIAKVQPIGFWPDRSIVQSLIEISINLIKWLCLCIGLILALAGCHQFIFRGGILFAFLRICCGALLIYLAVFGVGRLKKRRILP